MPSGKTREEYSDELREALGIHNPKSFSDTDLSFFEETDRIYGDTPIADLEAELNSISEQIPKKQANLKTLQEQSTGRIAQRIQNDLAEHQKKLTELMPAGEKVIEKVDKAELLQKLDSEESRLYKDMENKGLALDECVRQIRNAGVAEDLFKKSIRALEASDTTKMTYDQKFWDTHFGVGFDNSVVRDIKPMLIEYMNGQIDLLNAKKALTEIRETIEDVKENDKLYYGKNIPEWQKEANIVNCLKNATVSSIKTVNGVNFNYSIASDTEYADRQKEVADLIAKKGTLTNYLKIRKTLGKRPSDIDKTKFQTAFQKYYDARKEYKNLGFFQKAFAHIFSGNFYKPAALLRKRDAYLETLKSIGMTQEEIDTKVHEMDAPSPAAQPAEPPKDVPLREQFSEQQSETLKAESSLEAGKDQPAETKETVTVQPPAEEKQASNT